MLCWHLLDTLPTDAEDSNCAQFVDERFDLVWTEDLVALWSSSRLIVAFKPCGGSAQRTSFSSHTRQQKDIQAMQPCDSDPSLPVNDDRFSEHFTTPMAETSSYWLKACLDHLARVQSVGKTLAKQGMVEPCAFATAYLGIYSTLQHVLMFFLCGTLHALSGPSGGERPLLMMCHL